MLNIHKLLAFAIAFAVVFGTGLGSLMPSIPGLDTIGLEGSAWADDKKKKKKKVPAIIVTAPPVYPVGIGGDQIYGYATPMQFTEAERQGAEERPVQGSRQTGRRCWGYAHRSRWRGCWLDQLQGRQRQG